MKKVRTFINLTVLAAAMAVAACSADESNTYSAQLAKIEQYVDKEVEKDNTIYWTSNEGTYRLTRKDGTGDGLQAGDSLYFIYTGYNFSSYELRESNIFVTNDSTVNWAISDSTLFKTSPMVIELGEDGLLEGLRLGLAGIKAGEKCEVIFPSSLGMGKQEIGTIPANSPLAYKIEAKKIIKKK